MILLPVQILLIKLASKNPEFIERYYSNGVYPYISSFLRFFLGWIPFSVGDLLLAFGVFSLFRFLVHINSNTLQKFGSKINSFRCCSICNLFLFYFLWGLNYYRVPLATALELQKSKLHYCSASKCNRNYY